MSVSKQRGGIPDVDVLQVWQRLGDEPDSILVDVRTSAEWAFVGAPDLTELGKSPVMIEWQSFPGGQINPRFADQLVAELSARGAGPDTSLFFICRSGVRSLAAAQAAAAVGYRACHNVAAGFEGPPDAARHRGTVGGWKVAGLPWVQK